MRQRKKKEDARTTYQRQKEFLAAYGDTFNVVRAAEFSEVDPSAHYQWYRKDPKYAAAFEKRKTLAWNYLEAEAISRAGEGWCEDVYYQGAVCGQVRRYDSGLLQFLLRGLRPERYGNRTEVSGPAGEPVQARIEVIFVRPGETSSDG